MRALLGQAAIVVLLAGCAKGNGDDAAWRAAAAKAISQAEVGLRYWCDPGTSVAAIRDSAAQLRADLRTAAGSVRAMMLQSQSDEGAGEHERLAAMADFAAVAYDLGERATSARYVGPDDAQRDMRYLSLEMKVAVWERLSAEERAAFREGEALEAAHRRELMEMHKEQAQAFAAGSAELQARLKDVKRLEEVAEDNGTTIGMDVAVMERAANCLQVKLEPMYRLK